MGMWSLPETGVACDLIDLDVSVLGGQGQMGRRKELVLITSLSTNERCTDILPQSQPIHLDPRHPTPARLTSCLDRAFLSKANRYPPPDTRLHSHTPTFPPLRTHQCAVRTLKGLPTTDELGQNPPTWLVGDEYAGEQSANVVERYGKWDQGTGRETEDGVAK
jgi:hypothetical protein